MRLGAHRPDARSSRALLLYEGGAGRRAAHESDPWDDGYDGYDRYGRYDAETGLPHEWHRPGPGRRESGPPFATRAVRDSLTRWPDSLFRTEPERVVTFDTTSPDSPHRLAAIIRDTRDLLLVHCTGASGVGDTYGRPFCRGGLTLAKFFDVIDLSPARHIVVILEPGRPDEPWIEAALHDQYEYQAQRATGRLTLIAAHQDPGSSRPFLADALGGEGPLTAHALAGHPRARLLTAGGPDVRLTASDRRGGRGPVPGNRLGALARGLDRTRPALAKARESTASACSAAAPFALLLLAVAVVAGLLFALLRALPPMRGTWAVGVLLGLWAVLAVIGLLGVRRRTPPARARPPGTAPAAPRHRAFMDGVFTAWGFPAPLPDTAVRSRQPVPARPTREESRAAVEQSLNALYARLPVPRLRPPDPPVPSARPAPPAPPSSPSPDDNGTTP
ncbi:hypothetical protein GCM10010277_17180 [Streptomyces longisporoflavus]|uniref:hypothetical protein n=1 Tax=Streptomyces longisporoflavus TaxID=28044 RepID=UPI00167DA86E|nr:hypothetical protein [Streptomyces longisporoflavus]GGV32577.1 hypothetical protein GCM10010277_17180 [Streptomyces longisporoflavus]